MEVRDGPETKRVGARDWMAGGIEETIGRKGGSCSDGKRRRDRKETKEQTNVQMRKVRKARRWAELLRHSVSVRARGGGKRGGGDEVGVDGTGIGEVEREGGGRRGG